jgi:hypothetical protein
MSERQKILNTLPMLIFIIGQFFYDWLAPTEHTKWSIIYFSLSHIGFLLVTIHNIIYFKGYYKLFNIGLAFGFVLYIARQLTKWNMSYENYRISVNDFEQDVMISSVIAIVSIIIFIKLCRKVLKKN